MNKIKKLNRSKAQRIGRVRALVSGTATRPRLVVNRTNQHFYAQLIDDTKSVTLFSARTAANEKKKKSEQAFTIGESLAKKAVEKGIASAVFDRRSYQFHGRVKSFADGAKKGGLKI
jgi:large subunit ribosomal protein L18